MEKRTEQLHFFVTKKEVELIRNKSDEMGIKNESAYLRKMAIEGYSVQMDLSDVKEVVRLLRINSNNLNQYAKKANETGSIYLCDINELKAQQEKLWVTLKAILARLSEIK